jgi:hypothetical protein
MHDISLGKTEGEVLLADDLRQIITVENQIMANEIRAMMNSAVGGPVENKFYTRREQYAEVFRYMQMNLL